MSTLPAGLPQGKPNGPEDQPADGEPRETIRLRTVLDQLAERLAARSSDEAELLSGLGASLNYILEIYDHEMGGKRQELAVQILCGTYFIGQEWMPFKEPLDKSVATVLKLDHEDHAFIRYLNQLKVHRVIEWKSDGLGGYKVKLSRPEHWDYKRKREGNPTKRNYEVLHCPSEEQFELRFITIYGRPVGARPVVGASDIMSENGPAAANPDSKTPAKSSSTDTQDLDFRHQVGSADNRSVKGVFRHDVGNEGSPAPQKPHLAGVEGEVSDIMSVEVPIESLKRGTRERLSAVMGKIKEERPDAHAMLIRVLLETEAAPDVWLKWAEPQWIPLCLENPPVVEEGLRLLPERVRREQIHVASKLGFLAKIICELLRTGFTARKRPSNPTKPLARPAVRSECPDVRGGANLANPEEREKWMKDNFGPS